MPCRGAKPSRRSTWSTHTLERGGRLVLAVAWTDAGGSKLDGSRMVVSAPVPVPVVEAPQRNDVVCLAKVCCRRVQGWAGRGRRRRNYRAQAAHMSAYELFTVPQPWKNGCEVQASWKTVEISQSCSQTGRYEEPSHSTNRAAPLVWSCGRAIAMGMYILYSAVDI